MILNFQLRTIGVIMKKTTLQDIAATLNISRTTVWKVLSNRSGVSDELKGQVIEKAKELNYHFPQELTSYIQKDDESKPINIAIAVCRPETSIFWMTIIHEIAKELSTYNINLIYTYLPSVIDQDYVLPAQLTNETTHGIIVLNVYINKLIKRINDLSIPKVFMDISNTFPFDELNGDLIMSEGRTCIFQITEHLISQGIRNLGFIGDINYARTNYERYEGFLQALQKNNLIIKPEYCFTSSIGIDSYEEEINSYINQLKNLPEAFVCVSDYVANLLWQQLERRGLKIPEDISISGFDGNTEAPITANLTTVYVFNRNLGIRLASQIMYRLKHPKAVKEITYLNSEVVFGKSTQKFK